jgi:hypothetical protein
MSRGGPTAGWSRRTEPTLLRQLVKRLRRKRRWLLPESLTRIGRYAADSSIRNSARLALYLAARRLLSDPCMTVPPSVVHKYHFHVRPRFLR